MNSSEIHEMYIEKVIRYFVSHGYSIIGRSNNGAWDIEIEKIGWKYRVKIITVRSGGVIPSLRGQIMLKKMLEKKERGYQLVIVTNGHLNRNQKLNARSNGIYVFEHWSGGDFLSVPQEDMPEHQ